MHLAIVLAGLHAGSAHAMLMSYLMACCTAKHASSVGKQATLTCTYRIYRTSLAGITGLSLIDMSFLQLAGCGRSGCLAAPLVLHVKAFDMY